jgi:hypothetical protein
MAAKRSALQVWVVTVIITYFLADFIGTGKGKIVPVFNEISSMP